MICIPYSQHAIHLYIYVSHFAFDPNLLEVLKIKIKTVLDFSVPSILLTCAVCLFFLSQRVNLSFDFPFYGHLLREITVATGGKLEFALSIEVISVTVGLSACAWNIRSQTETFYCDGVRGDCGMVYKIKILIVCMKEFLSTRVCVSCVFSTCEPGHRAEVLSLNFEKDKSLELFLQIVPPGN